MIIPKSKLISGKVTGRKKGTKRDASKIIRRTAKVATSRFRNANAWNV